MPLELGAAFAPRRVEIIDVEQPAAPTVESLRSEQVLVALEALREALLTMPAPVVNVSEPDLSAIVQAVTSLKGPATADEIARAVVNEISPGGEPGMDSVLVKLTDALEKLDFRMQGLAGSGGGGVGVSDINDRATRVLGKVDVSNFPATQAITGNVGLNAGQNIIGAVSPSLSVYAAIGQIWVTGGVVALSSAAPEGSLHIENPAGSGRSVTVVQWSVFAQTGGARVRYFHEGTSTGTLVAPFQVSHGDTAPLTKSRLGVGVMTGGTEVPSGHMVVREAPLEKQVPITLPAGHSFAIEVVGYGLSATATDFSLSVAFREA